MDLFKIKYKEEATELIEGIEKALLSVENNPDAPALLEDIFRNMHTLKGNSSMFGFKMIAEFTHHLESIYELIRSGRLTLSKQIINITFSALDHLSLLINSDTSISERGRLSHTILSERVIDIVNSVSGSTQNGHSDVKVSVAGISITDNVLKIYNIKFAPENNFFLNGSNPLSQLNGLNEIGDCKIVCHLCAIPSLEECAIDKCYASWDITLKTRSSLSDIHNIFEFVGHLCKLEIKVREEEDAVYNPLIKEGSFLEINSNEELAAANPNAINKEPSASNTKQIISSIRVPSQRIDSLMSLVSELMTLQAKLGMLTEQNPQSELLAVSENLEKISTRLRDNAFSMSLVPLEHMVTPFHRLVRDLASELNKEIEFITEGTDTELDKNIMEGLSDPLMHLLRNSIDHGIEDPEVRVKSGKPRQGEILLKASCAGTNVYIEIRDDGKGMDLVKIRKKAVEKGIISNNDILSDKEVFNLVFLPGFTTAEKVSGISGRGVGMDVVKRGIADIRGQIKINSQVNKGTAITIKLPITVSIIDGLLVKINNADFVIPLSAVERCFEIPKAHPLNRFNNLIVLDGEQIPFISLSEEFDGTQNLTSVQEIVIVYYEETKIALIIDQIVGKFQAVLKPLGRYFLHMNNISGATILGDGKIALVLDTNNVVEQFLNKKVVHYVKDTTNKIVPDL